MIVMVEEFLRETKCICYGGTAINNILPEEAQFYDRDVEIPDYDFFSETPLAHAKELADRFHAKGYSDVEAKAGVHFGTYKVFVNFISMADITASPSRFVQVHSKRRHYYRWYPIHTSQLLTYEHVFGIVTSEW